MKKGVIRAVVVIALVGVAVYGVFSRRNGKAAGGAGEYATAKTGRGEIVNTITSTGTLQPVSTVDVGTQVSGIIDKVYADFNDTVTKGQVIAELDRTVLAGALDEAIAARNRAKALFELARDEYKRNEPLLEKGFISDQEFAALRTDYITQEASLQSAEASVTKARTNLNYATVTSPITGTVIERSIEVGQTVAASFSAPTLFVIAEDLGHMEILASVDEADIGGILQGQEVRFTVQAYPDRNFVGEVKQIRLQPTTTQNVVTYTVVIATENPDGVLLPGMTATVDFVIEKAVDVLQVSNAALRFSPSGDSATGRPPAQRPPSKKKGGVDRGAPDVAEGESAGLGGKPSAGEPHGNRQIDTTDGKRAVVWVLDQGMPRPEFIRVGITDGKMTEIRFAGNIREGTEVITGVRTLTQKKEKSVSLIPQPGPPGRR